MFGKYRVLKNKNLSLLLFGQLVSNMGIAISGVAIIWHIMGRFEEGNVAFYIALYWLVKLLTEVLSGPISGVVTDRVDRKK